MKGEDLEILCNRLQYVLEPVVCFAGAAEGANECFSDSAIPRIQQQHLSETCYQNLNVGNEDRSVPSSRFTSSGDSSPRQSKQLHANNLWEPHGTMGSGQSSNNIPNLSQYNTPSPTVTQLSGVAPSPLCRNAQRYLNADALGADSSSRLNANFAIQARRKVLNDGKTRKRNVEALEMIEKAIIPDKKNPLPMYQKANILPSLER